MFDFFNDWFMPIFATIFLVLAWGIVIALAIKLLFFGGTC